MMITYHCLGYPDFHNERFPHHSHPAAPEERSELLAPGGFIRRGERGETVQLSCISCVSHCPPVLPTCRLLETPADQINVLPPLGLLARNNSQGLQISFNKTE